MKKEFIPYEESVKLKELGFDEPCFGYHLCKNSALGVYLEITTEWIDLLPYDSSSCKAPLYQQAFRWFREKYGLMHIINPYNFTCEIDFLNKRIIDNKHGDFIPHEHIVDEEGEEIKHNSYEEAELACLNKLIEIVKNK